MSTTTQILIKEVNGEQVFCDATEIKLADKNKQGLIYKAESTYLVVREDDYGNELPAHKFAKLSDALRFIK